MSGLNTGWERLPSSIVAQSFLSTKAKRRVTIRHANPQPNGKPEAEEPLPEKKSDSFVYFRADRKMVRVLLNDIFYIESMKDS